MWYSTTEQRIPKRLADREGVQRFQCQTPPKYMYQHNQVWNLWCVVTEKNGVSNTWWGHQMETFSALLALCVGNSPATGEFPAHRPITRSFDIFFDLRLNQGLIKQWRGLWFKTPLRSLWRHRNASQTGVLSNAIAVPTSGKSAFSYMRNASIQMHLNYNYR